MDLHKIWLSIKYTQQMVKVTCIIPSTCSKKILPHLRKCISSVRKSAQIAKIHIIVVVVTDDKRVRNPLKKNIDLFLYAGEKPGFAKANNYAIEQTFNKERSDYYLLINDDAWVEKDFLGGFLQVIKMSKADLIVPLVFEKESSRIDSFGVEYFNSGYAKNSKVLNIDTTLASAGCLMVKASFLREMKSVFGHYFNSILHSYYEDVEFSIRAKAIGGIIQKAPKLTTHHAGSLSSGKKSYFVLYYTYRNVIWVVILTWPVSLIIRNIIKIFILQVWFFLYSSYRFSPLFYLKLIINTLRNLKALHSFRKKNLKSYQKSFKFEELFNGYTFRSGRGIAI